jgi:hypothetical protein
VINTRFKGRPDFMSTGRPLPAYPTIRDRAPTGIGFDLAKRSVKDLAINLRKSEARATILGRDPLDIGYLGDQSGTLTGQNL